MFTIYAGDSLIYCPSLISRNYVIIAPALNVEVNKPSSLTFSIPTINQKLALLELINRNSRLPDVKVYDGTNRIFFGRVLTNDKDFMKTREIHCEGEMAFLRDVIVRPDWVPSGSSISGAFNYFLGQYNSWCDTDHRLLAGTCDVTTEEDLSEYEWGTDQYIDMLSHITDRFLNKFGGFLQIRVEYSGGTETTYLDYLADPGDGEQVIQYGKNLLEFKEKADVTPLYTRIVPLGAMLDNTSGDSQERLTIKDVNSGLDYLQNDDAISKYGLIEQVKTYDEIDNATVLKSAGADDLAKAVLPQKSLELTVADLSFFGESNTRLTVGKKHRIYSAPHGYTDSEDKARLNRAEMKLDKFDETRYYFGNAQATISQEAVNTTRAMDQVANLALQTNRENEKLKESVNLILPKVNAITDYVTAQSTESGWRTRTWQSGTVEYATATTVTWSAWTVVSGETNIYMATAEVNLPGTINGYAVQATAEGTTPMALSVTKTSTKITLTAEKITANQAGLPASTAVSIYIIKT